MNSINIQYQDYSGMWVTVNRVSNNGYAIQQAMRVLKESMPDRKVRAADDNGRIVDFLG